MPTALLKVVGLDLSLTSTGICTLRDGVAQLRRVRSVGKKDATLSERRARLSRIAWDIVGPTAEADMVVIEAPAFSRTTGHMHDRSGLWWLIVDMLLAGDKPVPVVEVVSTSRAKYGTGKGNASKDQVLAAVVRRYPDVEVTGNDEADALILAAMGARHLGEPIESSLPIQHLAAMEAVRWPSEAS